MERGRNVPFAMIRQVHVDAAPLLYLSPVCNLQAVRNSNISPAEILNRVHAVKPVPLLGNLPGPQKRVYLPGGARACGITAQAGVGVQQRPAPDVARVAPRGLLGGLLAEALHMPRREDAKVRVCYIAHDDEVSLGYGTRPGQHAGVLLPEQNVASALGGSPACRLNESLQVALAGEVVGRHVVGQVRPVGRARGEDAKLCCRPGEVGAAVREEVQRRLG
mmetsp:Transcript_55478/g.125021  ORF Transcript_55478/g.125021 Transcript_55478/m.125021 type:complete len:220 (+) Transcript_55478:312-971(+)